MGARSADHLADTIPASASNPGTLSSAAKSRISPRRRAIPSSEAPPSHVDVLTRRPPTEHTSREANTAQVSTVGASGASDWDVSTAPIPIAPEPQRTDLTQTAGLSQNCETGKPKTPSRPIERTHNFRETNLGRKLVRLSPARPFDRPLRRNQPTNNRKQNNHPPDILPDVNPKRPVLGVYAPFRDSRSESRRASSGGVIDQNCYGAEL